MISNFFEHKIFERNVDFGLLILRLSIGILMLLHGVFKIINGVGFIENMVVANNLPSFVAYGVYIGEVFMPILIIMGLATRLSAFVFAFNCMTAAYLGHSANIFSLNATGGWELELLGLYFFGAIVLVFTGGGKYALSNKFIWD